MENNNNSMIHFTYINQMIVNNIFRSVGVLHSSTLRRQFYFRTKSIFHQIFLFCWNKVEVVDRENFSLFFVYFFKKFKVEFLIWSSGKTDFSNCFFFVCLKIIWFSLFPSLFFVRRKSRNKHFFHPDVKNTLNVQPK